MADASCHVNLKERPTSGETWRKEFARGIWWQYARVLIHQRAFSSKENLEISSWKGCNETTDISNKRIMEETFARLTRRLTTRPRIKLLPSVYFHDERRRIERFFRSDRSRNFLIWVERLETGQEVRRNTSWFRPIWTNPPDRYESFVITSNFPFRFGRGRSPCGFESSS